MLIYFSLIESDADKSKFEIIYYEYRDLMFYVANKILNNQQDAEDTVHQAFVKIIEILGKIDEPKCPKTRGLVVTIVEHKAIDLYRKKKKSVVVELDEEYYNVPSPSDIEAVDGMSDLARAMALLPTRYRELLLLKYDSGFSEREIAQLLSMTEANVKKTIQRAKVKLGTILEEQGVR